VIRVREIPPPEPRELRACGLAALAEAGVVYLPVHLVLTETRGLDLDVETLAAPFFLAYVGGALLACLFRASRAVATSAAILAVLAGALVGRGDVNVSVFAGVVALLVSVRIVSLALRDWRTPIHAELGWGALALGVETMVAGGAEPSWRPLLVVVVPLFFVASLASRATTVWTSDGVRDLDEAVRASWIRRAVAAAGALVVAMAAVVALGIRGGAFDRVGRWLTPAADAFASGFAWVLSQAARPVFWLVDRLGIDPEAVREFLDRLRAGGLGDSQELTQGDAALWQRLLGLLAFAAIGYALYRFLRRVRPTGSLEEPGSSGVVVSSAPLAEDVAPASRPVFRRELPADTVRRLYAEVLLALREQDLPKDPALTPAEFVPEVVSAFPAGHDDFGSLTRAYEDVRYGSLRLHRDRVRGLEARQRHLLDVVRGGPRRGAPSQ
jgi:hypothetical protein